MDIKEFLEQVRQSVMLKDKIDQLNSLQSEVRSTLKDGVKELGEEDSRGHIVVEVDDDTTGIRKVMHQRKVSKALDIEVAENILKEKNIHERCVTMVPVLNEDEIMAAFYEGLITEEDIDAMFPAKISWALVMTKS
jgi:hypothetical protein